MGRTDARTVPNMWPLSNAAPPQLRPIEAGPASKNTKCSIERSDPLSVFWVTQFQPLLDLES